MIAAFIIDSNLNSEAAEEILRFKLETFRDKDLPLADRDRAADWIINRAFGRVPLPVETSDDAIDLKKVVYEIRWLPPDPEDRSNFIEPTTGLV